MSNPKYLYVLNGVYEWSDEPPVYIGLSPYPNGVGWWNPSNLASKYVRWFDEDQLLASVVGYTDYPVGFKESLLRFKEVQFRALWSEYHHMWE